MRELLKKYFFITLGVILFFAVLLQGTLNFFKAHPVNATVSRCVLNLDAISDAKSRWMNDNNKTSNDIPTWGDLAPYAHDYGWTNGKPTCPARRNLYIGARRRSSAMFDRRPGPFHLWKAMILKQVNSCGQRNSLIFDLFRAFPAFSRLIASAFGKKQDPGHILTFNIWVFFKCRASGLTAWQIARARRRNCPKSRAFELLNVKI
jgi:hypothetical protein